MNCFDTLRVRGPRALRCGITVAILLLATAGAATAQGLFYAANSADQRVATAAARSEVPLAAVRHRMVHINAGELASHIAPAGMDAAADRVRKAQDLDGVVTIALFPDAVATFHRTHVEAAGDSGYAWTGEVRDREYSFATLIVDEGKVTGSIQLSRRFFRIDPIGNGLHRVTEIDHSKYPNRLNDAVVPPGLPAPRPKSQLDNVEPAINTQVRLLAAYTTKAKQQAPNVVNLVKLAVASANKAYVNTGIPITLVLAGTMSAGVYADGPDTGNQWSKRLSDVTGLNNPNTLKVVRTKREQLKADLVTLIVGNSLIYCGLAWIIPDPSPATSQYGYSEIAQGCLSGGIVLPHELGHNMGLNHDRFTYKQQTGLTPPNSQYNFGYVNLPARIVSIMSYLSACQAKGITCNYIPWFSTSKKKYQGKSVMGIAQNKAGGADSTRRLNETRTGISKYR